MVELGEALLVLMAKWIFPNIQFQDSPQTLSLSLSTSHLRRLEHVTRVKLLI
jgi:hypothetical protein